MPQSKHPFMQPEQTPGRQGWAITALVVGACCFPSLAAPFPTLPGIQERPMLQLVQSCFSMGPYPSEAEARMAANDAIAGGYTAEVKRRGNVWMVKLCR